jgi:hypothetical protein
MTPAIDAGYDPKILFQITNHTASEVRFQYHYNGTNTSGLSSPQRTNVWTTP